MGQLNSLKGCPVCGGDNGGKWTCAQCTPLVNVHRELIRNLQAWRSFFEAGEVDDVIVAGSGDGYCLWDVERFYGYRDRLAERQARAIELCLWSNIAERDAATAMGIQSTSPVSIYATVGLSRLLGMAYRREINYSLEVHHGSPVPR